MRQIKNLIIALNFVSALIGAGLASGKEVVVFLGNANLFSIALCGFLIGLFSYPFIQLGIRSDGNILSSLFPKNVWLGQLIIRSINIIFLGAMLGGAETLFYQITGLHCGGFIIAVIALILFEFGEKCIKGINAFIMPTIITLLLILLIKNHSPIQGTCVILSPLIYAGMNTTCAGVYAGNMCKNLKAKDAPIISLIIALFITLFLLLVRSIVIGYECAEIPLYFVSLDTNIGIIGAFVIMVSILTSCLSSLKLSASKRHMSPYIVCSFALILSFLGFSNVIKYVYPFIGAIGIFTLIVATIRIILPKLKICKKLGLDL